MIPLAKRIDAGLVWLLVVLMAAMVVTVTWQVATRYLLGQPSSYTEELATYLLIWISLLGAVYALRVKAHLGVDLLTRKLEGRRRKAVEYAAYLVIIAFAVIVLIYGGSRLVYVTLRLNQISAALQVPMGYVYLVLPLSGLLLVFYALVGMQEVRETAPASLVDERAVVTVE